MIRSVLIDTHVLLWAAGDPDRLSPVQAALLSDPATEILVSTISIVEIEIKRAIGKLEMPHSCDDVRRSIAAEWLPLGAVHAMALRELPLIHRDPFDRMLIAQAITDAKEFVSSDAVMEGYQAEGLRLVR